MTDDQSIRLRALDPHTSFIVQAPAGSGKTSLLIQRYLKLLTVVQEPEEILAITFTRKAAQEMKWRILSALYEPAEQMPLTQELVQVVLKRNAKLGWDLLQEPARLRIQTFDSFCAELAYRVPLKSQQSRQKTILNQTERVFQAVVHDFLESSLLEDKPWRDSVQQFLYLLGNHGPQVEKLLVNMLNARDQWLPYLVPLRMAVRHEAQEDILQKQLNLAWQALIDDFERRFEREWATWGSELMPLMVFAKIPLPFDGAPLCEADAPFGRFSLDNACFLAKWLLTQEGQLRKSWTQKQGFPAPSSSKNPLEKQAWQDMKQRVTACALSLETEGASFVHLLQEVLRLPEPVYTPEEWETLRALLDILPLLVAHLDFHFQEQNLTDFTSIAQGARRALGTAEEPTDLTLFLDTQIQHLLIDEFQDTSVPQFHLIEQLIHYWDEKEQRTLFLVGDPMQSIYRFRQAEVGLFLKVKENGIAGIRCEALQLTRNFRTRPEVLDWVNSLFPQIFPQQADLFSGAIPYSPSVAARPAAAHAGAECHYFLSEHEEMAHLVTVVQQIRTQHPNHRIAILVKTRQQAKPVIQYLSAHQIPYQSMGLDRLMDKMVVSDLIALLQALLQPGDPVPWLAVLRAPWCGLSLSDLTFLLGDVRSPVPIWQRLEKAIKTPPSELSEAARDRFQMVWGVLKKAMHDYPERGSLRGWLETAWKELKGDVYLSPEEQVYSVWFFDILEQKTQPGETLDLPLFLFELSDQTVDQPTSDPNPVQIMTIHKSKGLEFDTVILPALNRSARRSDPALLVWKEYWDSEQFHLLLAPFQKKSPSQKWQYLNGLENEQLDQEQRRLLYVAVTRARENLYLLASGKENRATGFWKWLKPDILAQQDPVHKQTVDETADPTDHSLLMAPHPPLLCRLPQSFFEHHPLEKFSPFQNGSPHGKNGIFLKNDAQAKQLGQLIHRVLEYTVQYHDHVLTPEEWDDQSLFLAQWIRQYPALISQKNEALAQLKKILHQIAVDPVGRWILDPHHVDSQAELRVFYQDAFYVIDRYFMDADGTHWIIDYKTSLHRDMAHDKQMAQLNTYRNCLEAMGKNPVKTALYWVQIPELEQLSSTDTVDFRLIDKIQ